MDEAQRDGILQAFETALNGMGETFGADFAEVGLDGAIKRLEERTIKHHKQFGTWIDAPESERVAAMAWAAAELLIGAFVNGGVWHD